MTDKQRRKIVLEAKIQIIDAINLGSPTSIFECIIEESIQKAIDYSQQRELFKSFLEKVNKDIEYGGDLTWQTREEAKELLKLLNCG
jgi:hypothetical protein